MEFRLELTRGHGARRAAALIERALYAWNIDDPGAALLLVVTELIENVHQHTRGDGELRLALGADEILVHVSDTSAALPEVQDPSLDHAGGRGLRLVQALTKGWGVQPAATGKLVWAELALTAPTGRGSYARRSVFAQAASEPARGRSVCE